MLYRVHRDFEGQSKQKNIGGPECHHLTECALDASSNINSSNIKKKRSGHLSPFRSQIILLALLLLTITLFAQPSSATADEALVAGDEAACILNDSEQTIAAMLEKSPTQNRPQLSCHPILHQVARERAMDMAQRGYFYHVNPDGIGPNYSVQEAGYQLPEWWGNEPTANYIESIAAGYPNSLAAWVAWMRSPSHRTHLLASDPFYSEQVNYGVGVVDAPDSEYGFYYVVLTAPAEDLAQP